MFGCYLGNPEFHEKLKASTQKTNMYAELVNVLAKAECATTRDVIRVTFLEIALCMK